MFAYALIIFLSAFLLFQVQPIIARYILPWFGGTPAVWSTCMLFFQMVLLGGYAYAHWISTRLKPRRQGSLHCTIITASVIVLVVSGLFWSTPIMPGTNWKTGGSEMPVVNILLLLSVSVGLPFFILSTTGPLLQRWFSLHYSGRSPYRLYSLSNAGSLAALLSYPFIVEPAFRLRTQGWTWSIMFMVYGCACGYLAVKAAGIGANPNKSMRNVIDTDRNSEGPDGNEKGKLFVKPGWSEKIIWILLAAGASTMLLAVTNQMCQEVAVIPFLWVLPLSIYLLTFIICFGHDKWYPSWFPVVFVMATFLMAFTLIPRMGICLVGQILIYSFGLFVFCMVCHGELVKLKPHPVFLTSFYLCISIGGAIGGIFVALVAPWVFNWFWELPAGMAVCLSLGMYVMLRDRGSWLRSRGILAEILLLSLSLSFLAVQVFYKKETQLGAIWNYGAGGAGFAIAVFSWLFKRKRHKLFRWTKALIYLVAAGLITLLSVEIRMGIRYANVTQLHSSRNFFGVLRVTQKKPSYTNDVWNRLVHGSIIHGMQSTLPEKRNLPLSYYYPESGVGRILTHHPGKTSEMNSGLQIGAVGLGIGTIATYVDEKDYLRFYEINPRVCSLALGEGGFFSYLSDCPAEFDIVLGDARLSLERELEEKDPTRFDILVLDAFSSDAVPVHLLTREAFEIYIMRLKKDGVLAVHVSNRHIRLAPVVWKIAEHFGLECILIKSKSDKKLGRFAASWMILTKDKEILQIEEIAEGAKHKPREDPGRYSLWTDDYSNLFRYLK